MARELVAERGMARCVGSLVLATLALLLVGCNEEGVIRVHSLTFKGVNSIEESSLRSALATQASSKIPWGRKAYFDRTRFDTDLKRIQTFYIDRGFPDARVTGFDVNLNKAQDAVDVSITVMEGEPIRVKTVNLVGFEVIPQGDLTALQRQMPLKTGQPRDRQLLLSSHELTVNALRNHGYPYSAVNVSEDLGQDGKSATLTFTAEPGRLAHFGSVDITGNERVSDNVIRRGLAYKEGDLYSRRALQETQRRLYATQLFQFVNVVPLAPGTKSTEPPPGTTPGPPSVSFLTQPGTLAPVPAGQTGPQTGPPSTPPAVQPPEVPTGITVAEGKPQRLTFGVGYGTEEKGRVDVQYRRLNFFGGGRTATAHARWSSLDRGVRLEFSQPYTFAPSLTTGLSGQQWYTYTPAYRSVTSGAKATLTHRTSARTFWSVSLMSERDTSSVAASVLSNVKLRNDLIALGLNPITGEQRGSLNAIGFDLQFSTTDNPLNARRGYQATFHAEQAGRVLPGSFKYSSLSIEGRHYLPIGNRIVWANRGQIANIAPYNDDPTFVPFGKRYFLGGATTVRGWGIYEIGPLSGGLPVGGDSMASFTSEVRARISGNFGGVLFLDAGNVWAKSFGMNIHDLRYAVGPGLRYQTPIGPLRFDFGYQLNPEPGLLVNGEPQKRRWRVHFSVGQAF